MFSIVIPLYNKEKQLGHTLETVINQTFRNFEVIIIDDGSTDNSIAVLDSFTDERIRLFHQKNAGVSMARNRGIAEAKYELIAFLDADDEWSSEYLEVQYQLYKKYPDCSVFGCNYEFVNKTGQTTPTIIRKLSFNSTDGILSNYFEVASNSHPPLCASSVIVKKSAIMSVGGFPVGIKSGEDLLTWTRLALDFKIAYSRKIVASYFFDFYEFNKNPRILDVEDFVGNELINLYKNNRNIPSLRKYVALWYKTKMSILLRYATWYTIIKNSWNAIQYNPTEIRSYIYLFLAFFPIKFRLYLLKYSSINSR